MAKTQHKKDIHFLVSSYFPEQSLRTTLPKLEGLLGTLLPRIEGPPDASIFPTYDSLLDTQISLYISKKLLTAGVKKSLYLERLLSNDLSWAKKIQAYLGISFPTTEPPLRDSYQEQFSKINRTKKSPELIFAVDFGPETVEWLRPHFEEIYMNHQRGTKYTHIMNFILSKGSLPTIMLLREKLEESSGRFWRFWGHLKYLIIFSTIRKENLEALLQGLPEFRKEYFETIVEYRHLEHDLEMVKYVLENTSGRNQRLYTGNRIATSPLTIVKYLVENGYVNEPKDLLVSSIRNRRDPKIIEYLFEKYPDEIEDGEIEYIAHNTIIDFFVKTGRLKLVDLNSLADNYFKYGATKNSFEKFVNLYVDVLCGGDLEGALRDYEILRYADIFTRDAWKYLFDELSSSMSLDLWKKFVRAYINQGKDKRTSIKAINKSKILSKEQREWLEKVADDE